MQSALATIALTLPLLLTATPAAAETTDIRQRPPQDEVIYFVLTDRFANGDTTNDRGGMAGNRDITGFDPTSSRFYHGGDFRGLTGKLGYIKALGATAIWISPPFRNQPVIGTGAGAHAGYHGYYPLDFTAVDPHLGTRADFKAFVDQAHAMGIKVYLDIVINHTGDIIKYRECPESYCAYRSVADYPAEAYTPFIPAGLAEAKRPHWLNKVSNYHNRGESTFEGENSLLGDFAGLDDIRTESPEVVQGFIAVYGQWIDDFAIDGFRIDTARHVDPAFWRAFVPAMEARARARGIGHFHIFGEVNDADLVSTAAYSFTGGLPLVLDFPFQQAILDTVAKDSGSLAIARIFRGDTLYAGGADTALQMPTFTGNHDMGRITYQIRQVRPGISDLELYRRVRLANGLMMFSRGIPVLYYGDEQGFISDGNDNDAREDMMASRVAAYNDNPLLMNARTMATDTFDTDTPLFTETSAMIAARMSDDNLRYGRTTVVSYTTSGPGILAFSRGPAASGAPSFVLANTSQEPAEVKIAVAIASRRWRSVYGTCPTSVEAPGRYVVKLAPLDIVVCKADDAAENTLISATGTNPGEQK